MRNSEEDAVRKRSSVSTRTTPAQAATLGRPRLRRILLEDVLPLLVVSLIILAARSSVADHYVIPSGSMEHTLEIGDHVFVDKRAYGARIPFTDLELSAGARPARGEVVIFDHPHNGIRLIKRIVAVEGDVVSLRSGDLHIDGRSQRIDDAPPTEQISGHVAALNLAYGGGHDIASMRIPAGHLLMLGDARGNSGDGRMFGLIEESAIYGKATGVIYRRGEGLTWREL
jgi:signal peptidase I